MQPDQPIQACCRHPTLHILSPKAFLSFVSVQHFCPLRGCAFSHSALKQSGRTIPHELQAGWNGHAANSSKLVGLQPDGKLSWDVIFIVIISVRNFFFPFTGLYSFVIYTIHSYYNCELNPPNAYMPVGIRMIYLLVQSQTVTRDRHLRVTIIKAYWA